DYADIVKHGKNGKLVWTRAPALQLGGDTLDTTGGYASYDGASDKLYLAGTDTSQRAARVVLGSVNANYNDGQPLVVAQVDAKTLAVDWAVDLAAYGCGRWHVPFAQRAGNQVLSYCNDPTPGPLDAVAGRQGYVVRIPLNGNQPEVSGGGAFSKNPNDGSILNAVVERMAAIPDNVEENPVLPLADPGSGRLLLLTADSINGTAVWVHDPEARR